MIVEKSKRLIPRILDGNRRLGAKDRFEKECARAELSLKRRTRVSLLPRLRVDHPDQTRPNVLNAVLTCLVLDQFEQGLNSVVRSADECHALSKCHVG